jgi:hypothetical protein
MFADDTSMWITNVNHYELILDFRSVLSQISKWFLAIQLTLNIKKTSLVKFAPTKSYLCPLNLSYAGQTLFELNNIKFLGLQLDSHLTWKVHINYLLNKPSVICFIMRRRVHTLDIETLKFVYVAHFHSLIKYGIIFWGNSTTVHKVFYSSKKDIKNSVGNRPKIFM